MALSDYDNEVNHVRTMTEAHNRADKVQSTWYTKCSDCGEYGDRRSMTPVFNCDGTVDRFCANCSEKNGEQSRRGHEDSRNDR